MGNDDGDNSEIDMSKVIITITGNPESWTNTKVKVKIKSNIKAIQKEYSMDGGNTWKKYQNEIEVENNGIEIQARGINEKNEKTEVVKKKIENIDRLQPNIFVPSVKEMTTKLEITANTTDKDATTKDGKSGIKGYKFSKDNGSSWTDMKSEGKYIFDNLKSGTTYPIKVKAIDNAGNEIETDTINATTEENIIVPDGEGRIHFSKEPNTWTRETVKLQISTSEQGYGIEYSLDGNEYISYSEPIEINENKTIYARLTKGGKVGKSTTYVVDNIDRLQPKEFTVNIQEKTTNSIVVEGNTTDAESTKTDGNSGIKEYYFSKDNGKTWESNANKLDTRYTFINLIQGQKYNIKMKAVDNAGNQTITEVTETITEYVPGGDNIIFDYFPTEWTNGNVAVNIKSKDSKYQVEYSSNGSDWNKYNTEIVMSQNGVIYARLKDNIGQIGPIVTGNVKNIDKETPTITVSSGEVKNKNVIITANANDGQSGIKSYEFYAEGVLQSTQTTTSNSVTFTLPTTFGSTAVYVIVTDKAGNTKQSATITITDNTIKTLAELKLFRDRVNSGTTYQGVTITQISDINIGGSSSGNWIPINGFNGTYNGNNHTINGLYINHKTSNMSNMGLFGVTNSTTIIKNLNISGASIYSNSQKVGILAGHNRGTIENVNIQNGYVTSLYKAGGICGINEGGRIISCKNNATVNYIKTTGKGDASGWNIGGIVGENINNSSKISKCINTGSVTGIHGVGGICGSGHGTIELSVNKGTVTSTESSPEDGYSMIGGIIGFAAYESTITISNCYNTATISSVNDAGGIVGDAVGDGGKVTIQNCYNRGNVSAPQNKGGILGLKNQNGTLTITNSFWLSGTGPSYGIGWNGSTNNANNIGATPKNSSQLKNLVSTLGSAYKSDTKNINSGYPILSWQ